MEKAGIPELERRLIINLYWRQHATVRWDGEVGREVVVERGLDRAVGYHLYSSICSVNL